MTAEQKPTFSVSTATFFNEYNPRLVGSTYNRPDLSEISRTTQAVEELGEMGMEIVSRKAKPEQLAKVLTRKDLILSVHAPIWWDLPWAVKHGLQEENQVVGLAKNVVASAFVFGTLKTDFHLTDNLAQQCQAKTIVHPHGAEALIEHGYLDFRDKSTICVEPDSRRQARKGPWVWQPKEVLKMSQEHGLSIVMDVSHTIIAMNNLDLRTPWETLNDDCGRVKVVHLNASIPDPERGSPAMDERGLPITGDPNALAAIKELYQQALSDNPKINFVFEYFIGNIGCFKCNSFFI